MKPLIVAYSHKMRVGNILRARGIELTNDRNTFSYTWSKENCTMTLECAWNADRGKHEVLGYYIDDSYFYIEDLSPEVLKYFKNQCRKIARLIKEALLITAEFERSAEKTSNRLRKRTLKKLEKLI